MYVFYDIQENKILVKISEFIVWVYYLLYSSIRIYTIKSV